MRRPRRPAERRRRARPTIPPGHGVGIVHIGCGAFHRAHQAVYTDAALAAAGGDWRILAVSLRSTGIVDALNAQDGLFTVVVRGPGGPTAQVIGSIAGAIAAARDRDAVLAALADPATRIVSLTVTEKAYGIDRAAGDVDPAHPAVAADLATPRQPVGVLGLLVEGLRRRREAGVPPFTVLCCDNLPDNGALLRTGVVAFARRLDPDLAAFVEAEVAFPSTMVDRITPAATDATFRTREGLTGFADEAAVETEPFSQWVIEDHFPSGRPDWEAGGALFVEDVAPYEAMKLRMLNGAHSMLAYAGFLAGHALRPRRDGGPGAGALVRRHHRRRRRRWRRCPASTSPPMPTQLVERFANPAIAHETYQIAMDGTEKLPQRIGAPALDALRSRASDMRPFAFALAAWARYCLGVTETARPTIFATRGRGRSAPPSPKPDGRRGVWRAGSSRFPGSCRSRWRRTRPSSAPSKSCSRPCWTRAWPRWSRPRPPAAEPCASGGVRRYCVAFFSLYEPRSYSESASSELTMARWLSACG